MVRAFAQPRRRHGQEKSAAPAPASNNRLRLKSASCRCSRTGSGSSEAGDPQRRDPTLLAGQARRVNVPPPPRSRGRGAAGRERGKARLSVARNLWVRSYDVRDRDTVNPGAPFLEVVRLGYGLTAHDHLARTHVVRGCTIRTSHVRRGWTRLITAKGKVAAGTSITKLMVFSRPHHSSRRTGRAIQIILFGNVRLASHEPDMDHRAAARPAAGRGHRRSTERSH
jgi:hypothetical protein